MRTTVVTLLSATAFSLCAFARPQPQTAAISTLLARGYTSGWCGVHVIQYQKNEGPDGIGVIPTGDDTYHLPDSTGTNDYRLNVTLFDASEKDIGGVTLLSAPTGVEQGIDSQLPDVFEVEVFAKDSDPVQFSYSGQSWNSTDAQCSQGGYDSGSRGIDCGFSC